MANLSVIDFYYGAVLSHLLTSNSDNKPSLIEDANEKRVFEITTDKHSYILYTIHRSNGKRIIKDNVLSWSFSLSTKEILGLQANRDNGKRNVIALVLVNTKELANSKIIYFTDKHLEAKNVYNSDKQIEFTVRKYPNKNDYLLVIDKKVNKSIPVKQNLNLDY
ncbi:MAG: hypothetical protein LKJ17_06960 [Oscillospiraceae bacterium]|jgi:hypothetical protein|nr:hypothetical protein [Oscillospiraceae bacterium]